MPSCGSCVNCSRQAAVDVKPGEKAAPAPLLEMRNVSVVRGGRRVLRGLSLKLEQGETAAILGPNGAGKSTLLQLLTRDLYPLARRGARLRLLGREQWDIWALRAQLGIVLQDGWSPPPGLTAMELVLAGFFGSRVLPVAAPVSPGMRRQAREAMRQLGVAHLCRRSAATLSAGELRRLLIARALVHGPATLLLDEPGASLDPLARSQLRRHLRRLARSGPGLIVVTHQVEDLIPEIRRVLFLRGGRIIADGPRQRLLTPRSLAGLFGVSLREWSLTGWRKISP